MEWNPSTEGNTCQQTGTLNRVGDRWAPNGAFCFSSQVRGKSSGRRESDDTLSVFAISLQFVLQLSYKKWPVMWKAICVHYTSFGTPGWVACLQRTLLHILMDLFFFLFIFIFRIKFYIYMLTEDQSEYNENAIRNLNQISIEKPS